MTGSKVGSAEPLPVEGVDYPGHNCAFELEESSSHHDASPIIANPSIVSRSRTPLKYFAKASSKTGGAFGTDENNVIHE